MNGRDTNIEAIRTSSYYSQALGNRLPITAIDLESKRPLLLCGFFLGLR